MNWSNSIVHEIITNQFTQLFMSAFLTQTFRFHKIQITVTFFLLIFSKCLLKKNCLYIGREKEYSKKIIYELFKATDSIIKFYLDHPDKSSMYVCFLENDENRYLDFQEKFKLTNSRYFKNFSSIIFLYNNLSSV